MNDLEPIDAVHALRARGVDNGEELLEYGTPEQLLAVCSRWDARKGVGPGLLARWIRDRQFADEEPPAEDRRMARRRRFAEQAREYPPGYLAETHRELVERCWPDDLDRVSCGGSMVVFDTAYPLISMRCDECGFEAAVGPRDLHLLSPPEAPS